MNINVNTRNIIVALQEVLQSEMAEVFDDRVYIDKDFLLDLYGKVKTPYAVINFDGSRFDQADNLRTYDYIRSTYSFSILACTRNKKKYDAMFGEDTGLLAITDKIYETLINNQRLNDLVDQITLDDMSAESGKPEDASLLYEALGELKLSCYKDIFIR